MDWNGQIILAYLEEDDSRRVLFRARPLLSASGPVTHEKLEGFGQDGFLRVAPDKQEQHSFKERMRALGKLCVMDLRGATPAMGKIRPNKNFAPSKGEVNRFIVYSDTLRALPDDLVTEVVQEERGVIPMTRKYYLRTGGRIAGPFCQTGADCPVTRTLSPDSDRLFLVEMPDKTSRMFYWAQEHVAEQAAPEPVMPAKTPIREPAGEPAMEPETPVPAPAPDEEQPPEGTPAPDAAQAPAPEAAQTPAPVVPPAPVPVEALAPVPVTVSALLATPTPVIAAAPAPVAEPVSAPATPPAPAPNPPAPQETSAFRALALQVRESLTDAGFNVALGQAAELVLLCLCAPRVQLTGSCLADAHLAARTICALFPDDVALLTAEGEFEGGRTRLYCSDEPTVTQGGSRCYLESPWPVCCIISGDSWPSIVRRKPQRLSLPRASISASGREYPPQVRAWMDEINARIRKAGVPLPLQMRDSMASYLAYAPRLCGISHDEALRAAARLWVMPWLRFSGIRDGEILELVRT